MNKNKIPNLFIIGAPKCGTTALYEYLSCHPDVFMCYPKEPNYFSSDLANLSFVDTLSEYSDLFENCNENIKIIGEASAWYLYSETAVRNIYKFNSNAKIIVIIRNPLEVVRSLHSNYLFNYFEDQKNIKDAWDLQEKRQQGECIPKYCKEPKLLQYKDATSLGTQLQRLYDIFPEDQIKCILFDDFVGDTKKTYESVLEFLDLDTDNQVCFEKINSRKSHKVEFINKWLLNPPSVFRYVWKKARKVFGNKLVSCLDKIILLNTKTLKSERIDDELYYSLINGYDDEIKKISLIMNKDLSLWYTNKK